MACSPTGSFVHGIIQARILEWVAIYSSRDLPNPGIEPVPPALAGGFVTTDPAGKPIKHPVCYSKNRQQSINIIFYLTYCFYSVRYIVYVNTSKKKLDDSLDKIIYSHKTDRDKLMVLIWY